MGNKYAGILQKSMLESKLVCYNCGPCHGTRMASAPQEEWKTNASIPFRKIVDALI